MNKILDVVEDIKQNITDNQYKTIMESLMEMNKMYNNGVQLLQGNQKRNEFVRMFNWLDTKLEEYIIKRQYDSRYYENIDFVKKVLELYLFQIPKKQTSKIYHQHIDFKYGEEEEGY